MPPDRFPTIRVEIEGMRHQILTAIGNALRGRDSELQEAVDNFLKDYQFQRDVERMTEQIFHDELKSAVKTAVNKAMYEPEFKELLAKAVFRSLTGADPTSGAQPSASP